MFWINGFHPDWGKSVDADDDDTVPRSCDVVETDDIVEVGVRSMRPVMLTDDTWDSLARLRVLGSLFEDARKQYLLLVTDFDAETIRSTCRVDRWLEVGFDVEERFLGCEATIVSELCVRRVVTKQDGRFCGRCGDYNRDVRLPKDEEYACPSCRLNPYR